MLKENGLSSNSTSLCWVAAATLAVFLCALQMGVMLSLMMHRAGFSAVAPMALLASLLVAYRLAAQEGLTSAMRWWPVALTLGLLAVALAFAAFYYDLSWDGEWYHQSGIIGIARDWNPLTEPMRSFAEHRELWVRHYAKGPWYAAAAIYAATGRIECGKCITLLSLAAAFFAVLGACLSAGLRRSRALGVAAVVAINPVVMSELTTFLVDGVMVSLLIAASAAIFTGLRQPRAAVVVTGVSASIVCINSKFTGLIYLCFVFAAAAVWCLFKERQLLARLVSVMAGTLVLGVLVWGYNPYVTNTLYRHQPFYPLLGSAKYPSLEQQGQDGNERFETPKNMVGRSRVVRFGYSIFGRPGNQPYRVGPNASLMWPFTARPGDLYSYTYHETRVSGFGPFFSGCFLLSIAVGIWLLLAGNAPLRWALAVFAITIIASLLISQHLWWPRYGPQLWVLPIVPLAFAFREDTSRLRVRLSWVVLTVLFINAAIVAAVRLNWETRASLTLHHQLRELRSSGQTYDFSTYYFDDSARVRLTEAGVSFRDVGMEKLPDGHELESVVEGYPAAIRYRAARPK